MQPTDYVGMAGSDIIVNIKSGAIRLMIKKLQILVHFVKSFELNLAQKQHPTAGPSH